jgi:hypothetical protein
MKKDMELLAQQQQIINQYMHMNIEILNKKLENLEKNPNEDKNKTTNNLNSTHIINNIPTNNNISVSLSKEE